MNYDLWWRQKCHRPYTWSGSRCYHVIGNEWNNEHRLTTVVYYWMYIYIYSCMHIYLHKWACVRACVHVYFRWLQKFLCLIFINDRKCFVAWRRSGLFCGIAYRIKEKKELFSIKVRTNIVINSRRAIQSKFDRSG